MMILFLAICLATPLNAQQQNSAHQIFTAAGCGLLAGSAVGCLWALHYKIRTLETNLDYCINHNQQLQREVESLRSSQVKKFKKIDKLVKKHNDLKEFVWQAYYQLFRKNQQRSGVRLLKNTSRFSLVSDDEREQIRSIYINTTDWEIVVDRVMGYSDSSEYEYSTESSSDYVAMD